MRPAGPGLQLLRAHLPGAPGAPGWGASFPGSCSCQQLPQRPEQQPLPWHAICWELALRVITPLRRRGRERNVSLCISFGAGKERPGSEGSGQSGHRCSAQQQAQGRPAPVGRLVPGGHRPATERGWSQDRAPASAVQRVPQKMQSVRLCVFSKQLQEGSSW